MQNYTAHCNTSRYSEAPPLWLVILLRAGAIHVQMTLTPLPVVCRLQHCSFLIVGIFLPPSEVRLKPPAAYIAWKEDGKNPNQIISGLISRAVYCSSPACWGISSVGVLGFSPKCLR